MAKQVNMHFQGRIGDVIYYRWKDTWCMRSIAKKVHQDKKVKDQGKANGWSTTMGKSLREQVVEALPFPANFQMQTAVRRAFRLWLQNIPAAGETPSLELPYLGELSFNEAANLYTCLHVPLKVTLQSSNELALHIPALVPANDISGPANTTVVQWTIIAAGCDIASAKPTGQFTSVITMPYNAEAVPATDLSLPVNMHTASVSLVVVALQFYTGKEGNCKLVTDKRYLPSRVVGGVVN